LFKKVASLVHPRRIIRHFQTDTLFANSVYLMFSTVVQAIFGFVFWFLNARLFSPSDIGLASALISASTFIAYLSMLGFNSTFVRFLPTSKQRNDQLNTGLILVLITGILVATGYVAIIPVLAPKLEFATVHPIYSFGFIALSALAAVNLLTDSVFIAYRSSVYNLIVYTIQSVTKLALPLLFLGLGAYGVFMASGVAAAFACVLSLFFMIRNFSYRPEPRVSREVVRGVIRFSSASYVANLLNILPTLVLPLIIVDRLGAAKAGYYYLAFMLANLVYTVAYSVSQSLFAEGSYGEVAFHRLLLRATGFLMAIMVPVGIGLAVAGPFAVGIFGKSYGTGAAGTIVVLALAAPAVAAYVLSCVVLRITHQSMALVATNIVYVISVCGLAWLWSSSGLTGIALAWLAGNVLAAVAGFGLVGQRVLRERRSRTSLSNA
jgi:O-antigen/teichoic acid export membrane protein